MEDVTLVNNVTLHECNQAQYGGVEGYHARRTTRCLAVTRNTIQQLYNARSCALKCCVDLHISRQVVYVEDRPSCLRQSTE